MRDARLAELELLTLLEREGEKKLKDHQEHFGLSWRAVLEMLSALIEDGCLNGAAALMDIHNPAAERAYVVVTDLNRLAMKQSIPVRINHRGRLRLWRLRDELRADRGRDEWAILFDKRAWERELAVQVLFASEAEPLSLIFLDLDKFKSVNDTHGHGKGDEVLKRFFVIIRDIVGADGDAFRFGGDEVTVSLPRIGSERATKIAEQIRAQVETEFAGEDPAPTTSVGVATLKKPTTPQSATNVADGLLYQSKENGRNRVTSGSAD